MEKVMSSVKHDEKRPILGVMGVRTAFAAVVVLTFMCFAPSLSNDLLVWDDSGYIVNNTHIRNLSLETIGWALTTFYCNYWAPFMWLSLGVDYALWGLDPVGYHLTNVLLHALNAGLFFLLARALLKSYVAARGPDGDSDTFLREGQIEFSALLAALLFSLHPLRVESVTWAAERKDVLFLFFGLGALLQYLRYVGNGPERVGLKGGPVAFLSSPVYWLTVVLFILSLLSKSTLVTFPIVLLILDWFPLRRLSIPGAMPGVLLEKVPLLALSGIVSVVAVLSQGPSVITLEQADMASRILVAVRSIMGYLGLTLWPSGLGPFYLRPMNVGLFDPEYALPAAGFLLVSVACLATARRRPVFLTVWLLYVTTLLPVLGLAKVGPVSVADRFTYLPALPISLLLALGVVVAFTRASHSRVAVLGLGLALVSVIGALSIVTVRQIAFWKDDVTLWTRAIDLAPQTVGRPYYERSYAYARGGELDRAMADIDQAIAIAESKHYNRMFELYSSRARIFVSMGDLNRALSDYDRVIGEKPYPERAGYFMERGMVYRMQGKNQLAEEDFRAARMVPGPP